MITRTTTAICAAIFLVTISSQAEARRYSNIQQEQFCGDKYCGHWAMPQQQSHDVVRGRKFKKIATHKAKTAKRVQVASIGNEPLSESPSHSGLVAKAEQYLGQTAHQVGVRSTLWCSAFLRKLTGASGVDDRAISWLNKPRTSKGCIGCIAVMRHHVGIVKGYKNGNPVIVSGNHTGRRVGIGTYPSHRILAYVSL